MKKKAVTKGELAAFLDAYPRPLVVDTIRFMDPECTNWLDMSLPGDPEIDAKYGCPQGTWHRVVAQHIHDYEITDYTEPIKSVECPRYYIVEREGKK